VQCAQAVKAMTWQWQSKSQDDVHASVLGLATPYSTVTEA